MYQSLKTASIAAFIAAGAITTGASATPIYDTFGPLDGATFGGQGIPNQEVAVSNQYYDGDNIITVAMSATQRYGNPALTNDNAGTYFATTGSSIEGPNNLLGSLWNFNYYIKVEGLNGATPILTDYQFDLFYDFDTGLDTPIGSLGAINVTNGIAGGLGGVSPTATLVEGSENLMFGYLASPTPGLIVPPAGAFDPNAVGEYNFGIQVTRAGWNVETVAMDVQVVPEPASLALLTAGGLLMLRRR